MKRRNFVTFALASLGALHLPPLLASSVSEADAKNRHFEEMLRQYFRYDPTLQTHQVEYEMLSKRGGARDLCPMPVKITHAPDGVWCSIGDTAFNRELAIQDWRFRAAALMGIYSMRQHHRRPGSGDQVIQSTPEELEILNVLYQTVFAYSGETLVINARVSHSVEVISASFEYPFLHHYSSRLSLGHIYAQSA